jgi:hypothetical protein
MNTAISELIDSSAYETELEEKLSLISKDVLIEIVLSALKSEVPIENLGYLALRELCQRESPPTELLLLAHSFAQWVTCASSEELDGFFLKQARIQDPQNQSVLYALLEKRPNIDGNPCQREFETQVITQLLQIDPMNTVGIEASSILAQNHGSLPLSFINHLPNPLENIEFSNLLEKWRSRHNNPNAADG